MLLLHGRIQLLEDDGGRGNRIIVVRTKMTANAEKDCQVRTVLDVAADVATNVLIDLLLFFPFSRVAGLDLIEKSRLAGHGESGPCGSTLQSSCTTIASVEIL